MENESLKRDFLLLAIKEHQSSDDYRIAEDAEEYYKENNPTITNYQKFLYNSRGQAIPDKFAPNNKIASNWYFYFTVQAVQYLLGNGVSFSNDETKSKLGDDFDTVVSDLATKAKNGGVAFGFWNYDHLEAFKLTEFVPLWDEETGRLRAGIRYWQLSENKPIRMTLYEEDGVTQYIKKRDEDVAVLSEKRPYKLKVLTSVADGMEIADGSNYAALPIVPLWNINKQSDIVGKRGTIDAYDLMASGLINNVDEGAFVYWVIKNCGGMDDMDVAKFREQLKLTKVASVDSDAGTDVESRTVEAPFAGNQAALEQLEHQLYKDFMALNTSDISAGNVTATQIKSAYESLDHKTDLFELQLTKFINGILEIAGIDDKPTYTRSKTANRDEEVQMIVTASTVLPQSYVIEKLVTILGDIDRVDEVIAEKQREEMNRYIPLNDGGADE